MGLPCLWLGDVADDWESAIVPRLASALGRPWAAQSLLLLNR